MLPGSTSAIAIAAKKRIVNQGVSKRGWSRAKTPGSWRCSASDQESREMPIMPALVAISRIVAARAPT